MDNLILLGFKRKKKNFYKKLQLVLIFIDNL
jgi:hypothetical protein